MLIKLLQVISNIEIEMELERLYVEQFLADRRSTGSSNDHVISSSSDVLILDDSIVTRNSRSKKKKHNKDRSVSF